MVKNGNFSGVVEDWSKLLEKKYKTVPSRQWWEKTNSPNIISLSKRLKSKISNPGNSLISGVFRVSSKIINATKDIINTIK